MATGNVKYTGSAAAIKKGKLREITRGKLPEILIEWHRNYAKKHFEPNAKFVYDYAPRSYKYNMRKMKKFGHMLPLVWSGYTRQLATTRISVRASSAKTVRGKVGVPWYVTKFSKVAGHPNMAEEITKITDREKKELYNKFEKKLALAIESYQGTEKTSL